MHVKRHVRDLRSLLFMAMSWVVLTTAPAFGQVGSLEAICQGFLSSTGTPAPGNATILCDCLVREVQSNLSLAEMQAYQSSVDARRPLPKALEAKIMAVATSCLTQAQ